MELINITNRYLYNVSWVDTALCNFACGEGIDVWRIPVSQNLQFLDTFMAIMSPDELIRYKRFYQQADKNRFVVSHGTVRIILGKYLNLSAASLQFGESINKKPYLVSPNNANLHYNISHSGDWILMTVANTETGADTELMNEDFGFSDIIHENFSDEEAAYISAGQSVELFFILWTRKESLIKATGIGLIDNLKLLPALDGSFKCDGEIIQSAENWLVSSFKLDNNYAASIATGPMLNQIRFFDFNPGQGSIFLNL